MTAVIEPVEQPAEASIPEATPDEDLVEEDLLVEEISIDGMCGVY
ncbi:MAG: mycofactocin precursor MftA [Acidimicrobiales bacterium]